MPVALLDRPTFSVDLAAVVGTDTVVDTLVMNEGCQHTEADAEVVLHLPASTKLVGMILGSPPRKLHRADALHPQTLSTVLLVLEVAGLRDHPALDGVSHGIVAEDVEATE